MWYMMCLLPGMILDKKLASCKGPFKEKCTKKRKTHQENQQLTGIFVDRNADVLQDSFSFGPTKLFVSQVNKDQVVVRSSCDDGVTLDL